METAMSELANARLATQAAECSLCVELDGALIRSNTLVDSLLTLLRTRPARLYGLLRCVPRGRAALKTYLAEAVALDVEHLPYNRGLLAYLENESAGGRRIVLTTDGHEQVAQRVAEHLGIFSGVVGASGTSEGGGAGKLERLRALLRTHRFSFVGTKRSDLLLLEHAEEPMVADPSLGLVAGLRARRIRPVREFATGARRDLAVLRALRPHQWSKNVLVFLPLLLAHGLATAKLLQAGAAFACFCAMASATYIFNDLLDVEADRRHPRKRRRPFASGELQALHGIGAGLALAAAALTGAWLVTPGFFWCMALYAASGMAYSLFLKKIALVDVLVLSGLYTLRLLAGSAATGTPVSHWLACFSLFLFLSLALVKRCAELGNLQANEALPGNGRGYRIADLDQLRGLGTSSGYAAVVVFAFYISSHEVAALYRHAERLWLIAPLMIYWFSRVWLLCARGELDEDPVVFAISDRTSLLTGAAALLVVLASL